MEFLAKHFNNLKESLFKTYSTDAGKMLLHTATIGWILSAIAQIGGIANNDKISKDQKKFLIPQEVADAAINIFSFYTVTAFIQNFSKKMVYSGRIITPAIKKFCERELITIDKNTNIGKTVSEEIKRLKAFQTALKEENVAVPPEVTTKISAKLDRYESFEKEYTPFEGGVKVAGNVLGAIISSNIITPILRNPIAAARQKEAIAQEKLQSDANMYNASLATPDQKTFGIEDYKKQAAFKTTYPASGIKI